MLGRLVAVARLVEQAASDLDHAVAPDDPAGRMDAGRLGGCELRRDRRGVAQPGLDQSLIDLGLHRLIIDARKVEHLAANGAGRSENQGQQNNLVEKGAPTTSAALGTRPTRVPFHSRRALSKDSSTGTESIPSL